MAVGRRWSQWARRGALIGAGALSLAACATAPTPYGRLATTGVGADRTAASARPRAYNRPYQVRGRWYAPRDQPGYDEVGLASWYSYESPSRTTADGEPFDIRIASAAHTTLPIPSWLEVTNLENGRSARVRLNDRGPFVEGRIIDLSRAAAENLGFAARGVARVRVRYLGPAEPYAGRPMVRVRENRPALGVGARPADAGEEIVAARQTPPPLDAARAEVAEDAASATDAPTSAPTSASGPPDPDGPASAAAGGYSVQAGAFADRRNAQRAAERLSQAGAASVRTWTRADGGVLYRVVVGGWSQASQAAVARARIAELGFADARVVAP